MIHRRLPLFCVIVALLSHPFAGFAAAKPEDWVTKQGEKFRATPVQLLGPFALFLTEKMAGKRVVLGQLSEADCVRFNAAIANESPRAVRWTDAQGVATKSLLGNVQKLVNDAYSIAEFNRVPEPEFLVLLFASYNSKRAWECVEEFLPEYKRVGERFPGTFEVLFFGVRHGEAEHLLMMQRLKMPWLTPDRNELGDLRRLQLYGPSEGQRLLLITREGVPVASSECKTKGEVDALVGELEAMLFLMRPTAKRAWPDLIYYFRAVRQAAFQSGQAEPMLIGHLLDASSLQKAGISVVAARLQVSADGIVTSADVQPTGGVTSEVAAMLAQTLMKSAMVPAVDNGKFVEGSVEFRFEP